MLNAIMTEKKNNFKSRSLRSDVLQILRKGDHIRAHVSTFAMNFSHSVQENHPQISQIKKIKTRRSCGNL